jgi:hypothetical protein
MVYRITAYTVWILWFMSWVGYWEDDTIFHHATKSSTQLKTLIVYVWNFAFNILDYSWLQLLKFFNLNHGKWEITVNSRRAFETIMLLSPWLVRVGGLSFALQASPPPAPRLLWGSWVQSCPGMQPSAPSALPARRPIPLVASGREMVVLLVPAEVTVILLDIEGHFISLGQGKC